MKLTRKIEISQRVFTSKDLVRIANLLAKLHLPKADGISGRKFRVAFQDGTSVEGDSPEVFDDEWLTSGSRPVAVNMSYSNYAEGHHITVDLAHGNPSYSNLVTIVSNDAEWLNANFQALKDSLAKVRPQNAWVLRHPTLLFNLIALGIGSLGVLVIDLFTDLVLLRFIPTPPPIQISPWMHALFSSNLAYLFGWVWRWILGTMWGASSLRRWLLEMWPSIEFEFGAAHLQTEKVKRGRLAQVWVLVIIPILITLAYDLAKAHGLIKI